MDKIEKFLQKLWTDERNEAPRANARGASCERKARARSEVKNLAPPVLNRASLSNKLELLIIKVVTNKLDNLKYKKLNGFSDLYRARLGKIRVVFEMREKGNKIINIDYRKDVYKLSKVFGTEY